MSKLKKIFIVANVCLVVVMPIGLIFQRGYERVEANNSKSKELQDIKDHIMEEKLIPEYMKSIYDVNNDGRITSQDYLIIKNQ